MQEEYYQSLMTFFLLRSILNLMLYWDQLCIHLHSTMHSFIYKLLLIFLLHDLYVGSRAISQTYKTSLAIDVRALFIIFFTIYFVAQIILFLFLMGEQKFLMLLSPDQLISHISVALLLRWSV